MSTSFTTSAKVGSLFIFQNPSSRVGTDLLFHRETRQYHGCEGALLLCSGWEQVFPPCLGHRPSKAGLEMSMNLSSGLRVFLRLNQVKPHGRLVPVGFTCCHASTPGLSNRWSTCDLQGHKVREIALRRGFPLRCFQRLSLPNIATRRCSWRNNRITRGSSTPVLSY